MPPKKNRNIDGYDFSVSYAAEPVVDINTVVDNLYPRLVIAKGGALSVRYTLQNGTTRDDVIPEANLSGPLPAGRISSILAAGTTATSITLCY